MEWYTAESSQAASRTKAAWGEAPIQNTELCSMILDIAKVQVLEFAPDSEDIGEEITNTLGCLGFAAEQIAAVLELLDVDEAPPTPDRYVYAQLQQAKNLWIAGEVVNDDGSTGGEGFTYTPRPLDKTIQRIIRPSSGVADVY